MNVNKGPELSQHPCFNKEVKGRFGRVHLPVAPKCNIKCNYCNRKYDCVNESRPGVTSTVLSPMQAVHYMEQVLEKEPRITVAGIAGPGDPFANPGATLETMREIRKRFPDLILCLATNGLNLAQYVDEIGKIGVSHVTVTINTIDPEIGAKIYGWVRDGKVVYRGQKGASLLLSRQLEAVKSLKALGITVKVNTIVIPGINDRHITSVARKIADLGADLMNCMAMYPNEGTEFESIPEPSKEVMSAIRKEAERYVPQMRHCTRCRTDAVGLLEEDRTEEMRGCLSACSRMPMFPEEERPYVAVATREGVLVNQHLGEASRLQIWGKKEDGYFLVEERITPRPGTGPQRWKDMAALLRDCRAVLTGGIGEAPRTILEESGVRSVEMVGFIEQGLETIYSGKDTRPLKSRRGGGCASGGCKGSGFGCG